MSKNCAAGKTRVHGLFPQQWHLRCRGQNSTSGNASFAAVLACGKYKFRRHLRYIMDAAIQMRPRAALLLARSLLSVIGAPDTQLLLKPQPLHTESEKGLEGEAGPWIRSQPPAYIAFEAVGSGAIALLQRDLGLGR